MRSIHLRIRCECGRYLDAEIRSNLTDHVVDLVIEKCIDCADANYDEGYEDRKSEES